MIFRDREYRVPSEDKLYQNEFASLVGKFATRELRNPRYREINLLSCGFQLRPLYHPSRGTIGRDKNYKGMKVIHTQRSDINAFVSVLARLLYFSLFSLFFFCLFLSCIYIFFLVVFESSQQRVTP